MAVDLQSPRRLTLGAVSVPLYRVWQVAAYLACWLEVRLFTDLRNYFGPMKSPVAFYLASVALCAFTLLYFLHRPTGAPTTAEPSGRRYDVVLTVLLLGGLAAASFQGPVIAATPIDINASDVIPILETYVSRFRAGETVYKYIYFSYPLFPNHLPMQWLPYVVAEHIGADYRWMGLMLLLVLGFGAYQWVLIRQHQSWGQLLLKSVLPAALLCWILYKDPSIYAHTIETTIIAYYCILAAGVLTRSVLWQAVGLTVCLTSRYSVVLWVPLYGLILWFSAGRSHAIKVALLTLLGVVVVYVWPFLSKDWTIFTHALREYRIATVGEWTREYHLFNGVGFAGILLRHSSGTIQEKIDLLQRLLLMCGGGVLLVSGALYWWLRHRIDYRLLSLISLKWYLATFYAFLQIPYTYLTSLVLFISLFLILVIGTRSVMEPAAVDHA
ncbi:hypothetical protein LJ737_01690 [Hymenobacter sp. 15J16-1T3B]|uniref:hypothetical protein n=1 Tax=Hymenobacter sp. 15J16-1T3B TaxID=2886941 RepID=UPI001D108B31|nr:hypothetical protein [Hymenobacter sp. 15J16-1T3B]MCC3155931.1 hypothetical protein [Hymenobacter sp. 15J16-1T3B]